ncbi:MAG TPA: amidohydrolase family protein [Longimicrobium sp.]|nr:amidohydrolase family protein [Longimicrobium sp.]
MLIALLSLALQTPAPAQAQVDTAAQYVVLNHGRYAGDMRVTRDADSVIVRFIYQDRQRGPRVETRYWFAPDGSLVRLATRSLPAGAAPSSVWDRFEIVGQTVRFGSPGDSAGVPRDPSAYYNPRAYTPYDQARLAAHLLRQPDRSARIIPLGTATAEIVGEATVAVNGTPQRARLVMVDGLGLSPDGVWLDDAGELFASQAWWFITVRRGAEDALPTLRAVERGYHARRAEAVARRFSDARTGPLVIRNGDVFDSERGTVRPRTTVVIQGDRITAVGPADSVRIPAGARVIDATGKTVLPGLWDMHTHLHFVGEETTGLLYLAAGITTVRDVAADIDAALSQRERAQAGTFLSPRVLLAGFIEGPGRWAGPSGVLVRTEEEARDWVARYDSMGYRQIKLYNLVHPDLVPTIAEETHKRGMRLSGHVPRGLTVPGAVTLGFDEINHSAFLFSTFFQDSLYVPRMRAYSQVAASVAPTFDVDGREMTELILFLREKGTVVDGTFNVWQDRSVPLADGTDPVFGPTLAWLPPVVRRNMTPGGPGSPQETARAQAASAAYRRVLKRLFDAGVTLVPGTDNFPGLSYHGELEIYERAGIPAASVLQIATIVSARVMKEDKDYGSITAGKVADLVIVDGRPAERVRDIRRTTHVVRAGKLYDARALYEAAGLTPRW